MVTDPSTRSTRRAGAARWLRPFLMLSVVIGTLVLLGCENQQKVQRSVLSGYVLDTAGNRVVGAVVTSHRSLLSATSGEDGRYAFTSLDTGSHRLTVERDGFYTASRTMAVEFGNVRTDVDFRLQPLPNRIQWQVFRRGTATVTVDVTCVEPMICVAAYQGEHLPLMRTPPTLPAQEHRFELAPLRPNIPYYLTIEGQTPDGRRFTSASGTFRPVPIGDVPGAPPAPDAVAVVQTREGPKLTWQYTGADLLKGFRVYRGVGEGELTLWQDEDFVFAGQLFVVDEQAHPGVPMRYAVEAVDLDGNVSSQTVPVSLIPAGELDSDVTWTAGMSPIDLAGDIWVPKVRTLTIEPGVIIRVHPTDRAQMGFDPNHVELIVDGRLQIQASGSSPVRFISASPLPTTTDWEGIRLRTDASLQASIIENLELVHARDGLLLTRAPVAISGLLARYCETGVRVQGASAATLLNLSFDECATGLLVEDSWNCSFRSLYVRGGESGVRLLGNSACSVRDFGIRDVDSYGMQIEDARGASVRSGVLVSDRLGLLVKAGVADIAFVTIDAKNGIRIDGADRPDLQNCILVNRSMPNTGIGIEEKTTGRSYLYNNIFGFGAATRNCDQQGAPVLNVDPLFVGAGGAEFDYHLQGGSPLRNAASGGGQMGAYGYAGDS